MMLHSPRIRRSFRMAAGGAGLFLLAACGGSDAGETDVAAAPEDVDQEQSATISEKELASFRVPADSALTPQQVEAYIKTSLLQFDLIRAEAPKIHEKVKAMEERAKDGGLMAGLRNAAEGIGTMAQTGDLVGGSFVRSARTLGYNPAEMEYVRDRMGEVSAYLMTRPMIEQQVSMARQMKQQAESYRGQPGYGDEQIAEMIRTAEEMERSATENAGVARSVANNHKVLQRFRSNVTDPMWLSLGFAGGASGLLGMSGLADPNDAEAQKKLNEFRQVFTDALGNKVTPGMENTRAAGDQPAPIDPAAAPEGTDEN
ncbi:MAG TPA: hypothetical protein VFR81_15790 [Longimicrobium sp.]|nr:hypothetical protein [Longimicrobium sp.]